MFRLTDAGEIMAMEQELIAGGMPVEGVRSMCDLHSQVSRDVLVELIQDLHRRLDQQPRILIVVSRKLCNNFDQAHLSVVKRGTGLVFWRNGDG